MKAFGCLLVSLATALNVQRHVEEPLKPCKGKEVTAAGEMWKCDETSLEDCANSYTSSGQNTYFQCAIRGINCLTAGPQCKLPAGAPSCKALYDSGVQEDGAYPISLTTPDGPTTKKLYCDMKNGGWTLIGQVAGKAAMYDGWLRASKNEQNLETPQITSGAWASIPAVDLAVNHASQVRLSNEDISKWVKWEMDASRTVETWWNRGDGQSTINQAADHAVKVYNQDGGSSNCYQNKYGIMQIKQHGGSYPSAQVNGAGNTSPRDNCMSVGVQPSGTHDGYSQNGNGYDQPDSNRDWPNGDYTSPPFVNVWVGGAVVPAASSCKALYDSGVQEDGAYPISLTTPDGPTTKKLYCDMKNGGWTLIGQVAGKAAMYDGWLRAFKNEQNLQTPQITSGAWASIPAVDLAVNHASQVRLSSEDISKWVKWEMDASRTVETWWNRGDGQSTINQAKDHAVKVYNQDGGSSNCYQNKYGIMQIKQHGGSYPSAQLNGAGNTSPGDNCMSVGVQPSGTHDGYSQNGNGYDQPDSNRDWPNGDYTSPPFVNVWVGGADAAPTAG